jgi:transcriptional regulator with XRE-family HTH domain
MSEDITKLIGENLRNIRTERGVSREVLGEHLGISQQAVEKYENGSNRISGETMAKVALFLDFPVADLFVGIGKVLPKTHASEMIDWNDAKFIRQFNAIKNKKVREALKQCVRAMVIELSQFYADKKERPGK